MEVKEKFKGMTEEDIQTQINIINVVKILDEFKDEGLIKGGFSCGPNYENMIKEAREVYGIVPQEDRDTFETCLGMLMNYGT